MSASISAFLSAGSDSILERRSPKPLLKLTPSSLNVSACLAMRSLKNTSTQIPKMIGSETFIIVAFMWSEKRIPCALASAISASRNFTRAALLSLVESKISPVRRGVLSLSTLTVPSAVVNSIFASVAVSMVTDFSFEAKSFAPIVDTCVLESADQAPMRCGFALAYAFTALGARRSELPSRRTGFTADPLILA